MVILERDERPVVVLVSPEQYEKLGAAFEDAEDVEAFDAAMKEEGGHVAWERVKPTLAGPE